MLTPNESFVQYISGKKTPQSKYNFKELKATKIFLSYSNFRISEK